MGTHPETRPLLSLSIILTVLDGISQRQLLTKVVTNLGFLPGIERCVEGLSSLTNTCTQLQDGEEDGVESISCPWLARVVPWRDTLKLFLYFRRRKS